MPLKQKPKKKKKAPSKKKAIDLKSIREIVYPEVKVRLHNGEKPLTRKIARELLGWYAESENVKFKEEYLLKDASGAKVQCKYNTINVPYYPKNMEEIKQEILRFKSDGKRAWNFNGEPIIIGKTGLILNGQHTLIALEIACQEWELHPGKWIAWQEEPTIDKLLVLGVDEDDDTVNTLDTCRGRTQSDVFYRSEFFAHIARKDRKGMSRVCSYAVNTLWDRMGAEHAFAPRQTFSVAVEFIHAHPRIIEASEFIFVENGDNNISKYLSPGYAAGMMYLMGCSKSDPLKYIKDPQETSLDWSNWDKACEFFVCIAAGGNEVKPLKLAFLKLMSEEEGGTRLERLALVAQAWQQFAAKGKVTSLKLKYVDTEEGRELADIPSVGGIDLISFETD